MMEKLRAVSNNFVIKILMGFIILMIAITGIGNYLGKRQNDYAVMVNNHTISRVQFEQALALTLLREQQLLGEQFTEWATNDNYMQQLRQQVLHQLIDEVLLQQYVNNLRMDMDDEQIKEVIFHQPEFMIDGQFNFDRYRNFLHHIGLTSQQYAETLRKKLTVSQLLNAIANTEFMLNSEKEVLTSLIKQERVIHKAVINVSALAKKQLVNETEIKNYYQQHSNFFMLPEQFRVSYINLDATKIPKPQVSNLEIKSWYNLHKRDYIQQPRYKYSIIQLKTKADAAVLLEQLKKGAKFFQIAKSKSIDPITAPLGGKMEWMDTSDIPDELRNAKLQEKGQISEIIKSSIGYLIVRLDDIQPQSIIPLNTIRTMITNQIQQAKIINAYYKLQQKMIEAANNNSKSLALVEKATGIKAVKTGWFSLENLPKDLKPIWRLLGDKSFLLGNNSEVISSENHRALIVRLSQHRSARLESISKIHDIISLSIKREKAERQAEDKAEQLLSALNVGKPVDNLIFGSAIVMKRDNQDRITQTVFAIKPPEKNHISYGIGKDLQGNIVLIALYEVRYGKYHQLDDSSIFDSIRQHKNNMILTSLLKNLRQQSQIKYGRMN
ncbi:MAG: peptidylprolyl isomerase [Candidatus Dasytiphilus stammeri]